jgi:HSP20 family protein
VVSEYREPLLDVFEEKDHILVVAELPGIKESEISTELNGDVLIIKADGAKNKFYKELLLSATPSGLTSSYLNGILELRLSRNAPGASKSTASKADKRPGSASRKKSPR